MIVRQNPRQSGGLIDLTRKTRGYALPRMGVVVIAILLGLASLGQAAAEGKFPSVGMGSLAGRVTRWPAAPVGGPGISRPEAPAAGVKLMIHGPTRQEIASVHTDERGDYRIHLPSGTYRIEMAPSQRREFTKELPATIVIIQGQETRLDLHLDTGIR